MNENWNMGMNEDNRNENNMNVGNMNESNMNENNMNVNNMNENNMNYNETNETAAGSSNTGAYSSTDETSCSSANETAYSNANENNTGRESSETGYSYYNVNGFGSVKHNESQQKTQYDEFGYQIHSEPSKKTTKKKGSGTSKKSSSGFGKKLGLGIAAAAVLGLVGGGVFYGVNLFGNRVIYDTTAAGNVKLQETGAVKPTLAGDSIEESLQDLMENGSSSESSQMSLSTGGNSEHGSVAQVAADCMPSLVTIATISVVEMQSIFGGTQQYEAQGAGSGVIVGQNDTELLIATNSHVVNDAKSVSVGFVDETSVEALVKGTDEDTDLAIIAVKLTDIPAETADQLRIATIGSSDDLVLGEQVVAIGNALGYGQSVTSGYVSAFNRSLNLTDGSKVFTSENLIMFDAAINAGNSGGGLFNMKGELVGINEAKRSSSGSSSSPSVESMSYAIPIDKALPILQEMMNLQTREAVPEEEMGYLGVTCANVTEDIANSYNMPEGVCLTEVIAGSPAEAAGLLKGDVVVKVGDRSVSSFEELSEELGYYRVGETVEVVVMRANNGIYEEVTANVTLGDRSVLENYYESQEQQEQQGPQMNP